MSFDVLSEYWEKSPLLRLVAPIVCVAWEAMLFSRLAFLGAAMQPALGPEGLWLMLALMAASCLALFARHRFAVPVLLGELAIGLVAASLGMMSFVYLPPLVALYACVARGPWRDSVAGLAVALVSYAASLFVAVWSRDASRLAQVTVVEFGAAFSPLVVLAAVAGVALFSHVCFDRREAARQERCREEARQAELVRVAAARDEALRKGRVAAELHDSVGHDLTAIIALSEGLGGMTGNDELDAALASINELARAGLEDTRSAVRQLSGEGEAPREDALAKGNHVVPTSPHRWDEVDGVLGTARALGIVAALTETGRRASDPIQADLAFSVSREAVTNAIRYARGTGGGLVRRLTVSWDHGEDGSCMVTVRDDGAGCAEDAGAAGGTGLARLRERVELTGGTLEAGPASEGGWRVRAVLPPMTGGSS